MRPPRGPRPWAELARFSGLNSRMAPARARLTLPPMVTNLDDEFRFHATALNLRAQRQQVLATNIANAATPGFKARDLDFSAALSQALAGQSSQGQSSGAHFSA